MSEDDKIIAKVIFYMQKSQFQPKNMTDLRRQVKQQAKTLCNQYSMEKKPEEVEKMTELIITKMGKDKIFNQEMFSLKWSNLFQLYYNIFRYIQT